MNANLTVGLEKIQILIFDFSHFLIRSHVSTSEFHKWVHMQISRSGARALPSTFVGSDATFQKICSLK